MRTAILNGRPATWLELAVAPEWRRNEFKVRVHPLAGENGSCYAISMNERWVCSGTGGLTVFNGLDTVRHFLELLHISQFESGDTADLGLAEPAHRYCLCTDKQNVLLQCTCSKGCRTAH